MSIRYGIIYLYSNRKTKNNFNNVNKNSIGYYNLWVITFSSIKVILVVPNFERIKMFYLV